MKPEYISGGTQTFYLKHSKPRNHVSDEINGNFAVAIFFFLAFVCFTIFEFWKETIIAKEYEKNAADDQARIEKLLSRNAYWRCTRCGHLWRSGNALLSAPFCDVCKMNSVYGI